ncbi:helix-turn-helix domain-containing protein [Candidatus Woesearchaeota archaeon]|nr:helix-turn-helix domain-containing protein [Candidatus Woesearchaeota archaeon]
MNTTREVREEKMRQILDYLNKDSRARLTTMAKELGIPKSTIFDYMRDIRQRYVFTVVEKNRFPNLPRPYF